MKTTKSIHGFSRGHMCMIEEDARDRGDDPLCQPLHPLQTKSGTKSVPEIICILNLFVTPTD